jgi:ATP adenylyltransferase
MDALHAPWRIDYIKAPKIPRSDPTSSIFFDIGQSSDDEKNLVICRGKTCYALLNSFPYTGGHLMVVPYRQVAELGELSQDETLEVMDMTKRCIEALKKVMNPHGFNVGLNLGRVAGAGIEQHLHMHVVPRWNGDTNFMPVLGGTTVLPQALSEVASLLRKELSQN